MAAKRESISFEKEFFVGFTNSDGFPAPEGRIRGQTSQLWLQSRPSVLQNHERGWLRAARKNLTIWSPHSVAECTRSIPMPNVSVDQSRLGALIPSKSRSLYRRLSRRITGWNGKDRRDWVDKCLWTVRRRRLGCQADLAKRYSSRQILLAADGSVGDLPVK